MDLREQLVNYYRLLRHHGCNDSHSGNLSVRDGERIFVTPTGACADTLTPEELVVCTLDAPGAGASLDTPLHLAVYRQNPAARAVIHSHGPHAIAITLNGRDFRPPDFEGQLYFPTVPVVTIPFDRYVADSPALVAALLARHPVAVVRGHGVYAWGSDLNQAYKWSCSLELSAKTALLAHLAGTWLPE